MARIRKRRVSRESVAAEDTDSTPRRTDSTKDRIESTAKFILTATPTVFAFLTASLGLLADISGLGRFPSNFIPITAGLFAVIAIAAITIYIRSSPTRTSRAEKRLKLADIRDPGLRQIIDSAAREQAFLVAHLGEIQPSTPGGAK
ncbi:hypothetical protein C8D88_101578 [Lentzea atacamensis]|uniref:Uncharacterized protein n=1 Tax=Lentzea atacamensis TaxID=531938 RepID=A0A316ICU5_9PSEU|nr:hypothetical protein [Lentzea atacamensis]PWK90560.1 hypothetical protein C8D88_101578 [Lentzea atacamensis]